VRVRPVLVPVAVALLGALVPAAGPDVPADEDFWKPLGPPRRGTWRDVVREQPQTFAAYREARPTRPTSERTRLYVQPLLTRPPRDPLLLRRIETALAAFFGRPVTVRAPASIPARAWDRKARRIRLRKLLPRLIADLPADALFQVAVTDRELWLGGGNRAFGWASFRHRVGIMSTRRLGAEADPDRRRFRAVSLALHEAAHLLSIPHCLYYECLMNGARTMREADGRPLLLCPVCRAKLCWNLESAPESRYLALERAYRAVGLPAGAKRARAAAAELSRSSEEG